MTGLLRYPGGPAFYSVASRLMNKSGLIIVPPASFLIFLLTLPLALRLWCLLHTWCSPRLLHCRASLLWLRSLYLALRRWCLLHTRCSPRLLPLTLDCRASLLRRGFDRGWSLNLFATTLLWLRACAGRSILLERL